MTADTPIAIPDFAPNVLCRNLGLPEDFLVRLLKEDDWSFLIKTHAFVEAALTHLLTSTLRSEALSDSVALLDTSGGPASKVGFAKALGLLDAPAITYIQQLSTLRNLVVHNVRNVAFNLAEWYQACDPSKQKAFLKGQTYFNTIAPEGHRLDESTAYECARRLSSTSPKYLLWFNLQMLALHLHLRSASAQSRNALEAIGASILANALSSDRPV